MIPYVSLSGQTNDWQSQLSNLITDPKELLAIAEIPTDSREYHAIEQACADFQLRVPRAFADKIEKGNAKDPLLLQVLPSAQELLASPGYSTDPLGEEAANPIPGLIHKYESRVLMTLSGQCAINCRYCFRRHFPYAENRLTRDHLQEITAYVANNTALNEVILSGGDPLSVSNTQIRRFLSELASIQHITRIRFHTRLPVVIPERIDQTLLDTFSNSKQKIIVVVHTNHPNELDERFDRAMAQLTNNRVTLLNQTVLLKNINDNPETLTKLSERLFSAGVMPYYLHLLDKVVGATHFEIPEHDAIGLHRALQTQLPGFLVPKLVREIAGKSSKTWVY
ncbi:EF-P beta-lysylation protein EpmB [Sessilibacter corallicola]|uniref:EF-P beta-lysylation protein EpmB n=1 Tax=Sessilibacter corallicola TaxID=2904075 RepID=UPI001E3034F2|nr:EF-P beta-lysylation protein EpmB [Sessilibacter corallicola]MCE2027427.1 EF-P beta-lysylation protein EpmB [Sessilibacter corallicola]